MQIKLLVPEIGVVVVAGAGAAVKGAAECDSVAEASVIVVVGNDIAWNNLPQFLPSLLFLLHYIFFCVRGRNDNDACTYCLMMRVVHTGSEIIKLPVPGIIN